MAFDWRKFTKDMGNVDADYRQMALFDLQQLLTNNPDFSLTSEQKSTCTEVMVTSFGPRERHTEVHSNALRVVGLVATRIEAPMLATLLRQLVDYITRPRAQHDKAQELTTEDRRNMVENSSVALKIIAESAPEAFTPALVKPLVDHVSSSNDEEKVSNEIYSVLSVVSARAGTGLALLYDTVLNGVIRSWSRSSSVLQRQQAACLAEVAPHLSPVSYAMLMDWCLQSLAGEAGDKLRLRVFVVSSVVTSSGPRWGADTAATAVQTLLTMRVMDPERETHDDDSSSDDELRDVVLRCLATIMRYCSATFAPHWQRVAEAAYRFTSWDPNYTEIPEGEDVDEAWQDDDDYYDNSDSSWRVRQGALHFFEEAYKYTERGAPYRLAVRQRLLAGSAPVLVKRLDDRVDSVKLGALRLLTLILSTSATTPKAAVVADIAPVAEPIREALRRALRSKDVKVQLATLTALGALLPVLGASPSLVDLAVTLTHSLPATTVGGVWAECLSVVAGIVRGAQPLLEGSADTSLTGKVAGLVKVVQTHAGDSFQKAAVAALTLLHAIVGGLKFLPNATAIATDLLAVAVRGLKKSDPQVRLAAVDGITALYINPAATALPPEASREALAVMRGMLQDDPTAVRAAASLGAMAAVVDEQARASIVKDLTSLLSKSNVAIREAGLRALRMVFQHAVVCDAAITTALIAALRGGVSPPLSDKDLSLAVLAVSLCASLAKCDSLIAAIDANLVQPVLAVLTAPSLPAVVTADAAQFFATLTKHAKADVGRLAAATTKAAFAATGEAAGLALATAAAAVAAYDRDASRVASLVKKCAGVMDELSTTATSEAALHAAVNALILGELGATTTLEPRARAALLKSVHSAHDIVRRSSESAIARASFAPCGRVLLDELLERTSTASPSERYACLRAVKGTILQATADPAAPLCADAALRNRVVELLRSGMDHDPRGYRDLVGEAMANLALLDPAAALLGSQRSVLADMSGPPTAQLVAVTTLKYATLTLREQSDDLFVEPLAVGLAMLRRDASPSLRGAILHLLSTVTHRRPSLLARLASLDDILRALINELEVDSSQVDIISLGPFQHIEDRGLEVRKAAFDCVATLLEHARSMNTQLISEAHAALALQRFVAAMAVVAKQSEEQKRTMENDLDNKVTAAQCMERLLRLPAGRVPAIQQANEIVAMLTARVAGDASKLEARELTIRKAAIAIIAILREDPFGGHTVFASLPAAPS